MRFFKVDKIKVKTTIFDIAYLRAEILYITQRVFISLSSTASDWLGPKEKKFYQNFQYRDTQK